MAVKENLYVQVDTLIYLFKIHIPSLDQNKENFKSLMGSRGGEVHTHTHTHTHILMADSCCCTAEINTTL